MDAAAEGRGRRLEGIDLLRGAVMVLMALDHTRDYFGDLRLDPTRLETTTPALFLTRWVTHFCAPVFVFLAGTAAWLYGSRGRTRGQLARFLLTRGLWLIVLEFTLVTFAWMFSWTTGIWFLQVIAAIGIAMVALAGLVFLPPRVLLVVALALVAGHNLLDDVEPELGRFGWVWSFLHVQAPVLFAGQILIFVYPVLAWIGVLALGYALGPVTRLPRERRRRVVATLGIAALAGFVVLRASNLYGDPDPWTRQGSLLWTTFSFLNCQKYPPSLCFLGMTLGPALCFLAWVDREGLGQGSSPLARLSRALIVFGRVPLFYYVAHIFLIHAAALVTYRVTHGQAFSSTRDGLPLLFTGQSFPGWYAHSLGIVYLAWALTVLALYPACRWYAERKRRGRSALWSYL